MRSFNFGDKYKYTDFFLPYFLHTVYAYSTSGKQIEPRQRKAAVLQRQVTIGNMPWPFSRSIFPNCFQGLCKIPVLQSQLGNQVLPPLLIQQVLERGTWALQSILPLSGDANLYNSILLTKRQHPIIISEHLLYWMGAGRWSLSTPTMSI